MYRRGMGEAMMIDDAATEERDHRLAQGVTAAMATLTKCVEAAEATLQRQGSRRWAARHD